MPIFQEVRKMNFIRKAIAAKAFIFTEDSEITGPEWFGNLLNSDKAYIDRAIINGHSKVYGCTILSLIHISEPTRH